MVENEILNNYVNFMNFLGQVFGSAYEIVLQDMSARKLYAVMNGYISGKKVDDPLTDYAKHVEKSKIWEKTKYLTNVKTYTRSGHLVISSFYFITKDDKLIGVLSINFDTVENRNSGFFDTGALRMFDFLETTKKDHMLQPFVQNTEGASERKESLEDMMDIQSVMSNIIHKVVYEYKERNNLSDKVLKQKDRREVVRLLADRGVFLVKDSVKEIAKILHCSDASVYRYLSDFEE